MTLCAFVVAAALIAVPAAGGAVNSGALRETTPLSEIARKSQDTRATELIGLKTVDVHGQALGRVEDVILAEAGEVHYAVLSFNTGLGLDDKLYTYPLSRLAPGRARGEIVVQADRKALLEEAGTGMLALVLRLYDPNALVADPPFLRASELLGRTIPSYHGSAPGIVEDLVLNLASGRLRYVVAEIEGTRFALPPHTLTLHDRALSLQLTLLSRLTFSGQTPQPWRHRSRTRCFSAASRCAWASGLS